MATLKRNKPGATNASDGLAASSAAFGEEFPKAIRTVRLIITRSEPLASKGLLAVSAGEALPVPGVITIGHPTLGDHLAAFDTLGSKLLLITLGTVDVMLLRYEALGAYRVLAGAADETLLVPLPGLILHLLHTSFEDISTPITSCGELGIIARTTVDPVSLGSKLLVHKTGPALVAEEAGLMPMFLLIGQVLGVDANNLSTLVTIVGEHILVTLDAVWVVVSQDIPVTSQTVVAMVAEHCFGLCRMIRTLPDNKLFRS